jgi:dipeptidyl aminopeptidase/acylaminoacyl peptidase
MTRQTALTAAIAAALIAPLLAQPRPALTAADYARAEKFLAANVQGLVVGGSVTPNWLPDGRFWFRNQTLNGAEIVVVDPAKKTRTAYHDCAAAGVDCTTEAPAAGRGGRGGDGGRGGGGRGGQSSDSKPLNVSPDGTRAVFVRDWNLWVRDMKTGQERALTTDGVKYFGYATDNAGWSSSDRAIVAWSPDSKKVATQQQDERNVGEMYLVSTTVGHPTLRVSKFPLPGDPVMAMLHRVIVDTGTGTVTRLKMEPDFHRATLGDDISMSDYNWSADGSQLALASVSRDHKHVWVRVADAATGAVRDVFDETTPTQFESRTGWRVLWATNEIVWHSERDNWGQLYLYDLQTGKMKRRITTGEGPVMQIARVDEKTRTLWFGANGREKGQDPYFLHFYRTSLDPSTTLGAVGAVVSLTPDNGTHTIQISPSGQYIVDTFSTPDTPPTAVLRDADGREVLLLAKADISKLLATGWKPPMPITMTAHDGKTDIHGLLFRPTNFDPSKKYPIVNNVYPGPQTGSTGSRAFTAARGDRQALAELGFIVVTIDGMGTPGRSKSSSGGFWCISPTCGEVWRGGARLRCCRWPARL